MANFKYNYEGVEKLILEAFLNATRGLNSHDIKESINLNCSINTIERAVHRLLNKGFLNADGKKVHRVLTITERGLKELCDIAQMKNKPFPVEKKVVPVREEVVPVREEVVPVREEVVPVKEEPVKIQPIKDVSYKDVLKFKKKYAADSIMSIDFRSGAYDMLAYLICNDLIDIDAFNKFIK